MATVKISELPSGQNIGMPSNAAVNFSSTTSGAGAKDVGIARAAAGLLHVTNGGAGEAQMFCQTIDAGGNTSNVRIRLAGAGDSFQLASGGTINWFSGSPIGSGTIDATIKRAGANLVGLTDGSTGGAGFEFTEMTAPSAGASNTARLFCRDNGAGKSQLCVIFATGAIQVVATEP